MSTRLIINADDFGAHAQVNEAIRLGFEKGALSSASLLANGTHTEEAIKLARTLTLPVGLHLNLTMGTALAPPKAVPALLDESGNFKFSAGQLIRRLTLGKQGALLAQIRAEFEAQLAFVADHGLKLTHLDSHQHVHMIPAVFAVMQECAGRFNITRCRFSRELLLLELMRRHPLQIMARQNIIKWCVLRTMAWRIHPNLLCPDEFFGVIHSGLIDEAILQGIIKRLPKERSLEIALHPCLPLAAQVGYAKTPWMKEFLAEPGRVLEFHAVMAASIKELIAEREIELINFAQLEKS